MNAPLRSTSPSPAPDAPQLNDALPDHLKARAARAGIEILSYEDGYAVAFNGDVLAQACTVDQVVNWIDGFECGGDTVSTGTFVELVAAEQIIQTLAAQMTDKQKLSAAESLVAAGFPFEDASRCKLRRAAIAAARLAGAA